MARTNAQGGSQLCSTGGGQLQHRTGKPTLYRSQTLPLKYRSDECSSSARVGGTNLETKTLRKSYKNRQTKLILNQMLSHLFRANPTEPSRQKGRSVEFQLSPLEKACDPSNGSSIEVLELLTEHAEKDSELLELATNAINQIKLNS